MLLCCHKQLVVVGGSCDASVGSCDPAVGSCDPAVAQFSIQWCVSCCVHAGPTILVVYSGGPLDISWAKENDNVTAILQSFFPAQTAGLALALVLIGKYNPAGRLPNTWPASLDQVRGVSFPFSLQIGVGPCYMWILLCFLTPITQTYVHT